MAHSFLIGNIMVSSEEFLDKIGNISRFLAQPVASPEVLDFREGAVAFQDVTGVPKSLIPDYEPIGIGKPMSVEILGLYTGNVPFALFGKPDLLVASAVKASETFDAAPRAINQLVKDIEDRKYIQPSALTMGCPIVYYTPSLVNETMFCSFELMVDTLNEKIFQDMSKLFSAAAGIPVFAPGSAYLFAGSILMGIFGELGKLLLQGKPFLEDSLSLRFDTPEMPLVLASMVVLYNDKDKSEFESSYSTGLVGQPPKSRIAMLHRSTKAEYKGDAPYIIISLDGRKRSNLDEFAPKLASAALLEQFYQESGTTGQVVNALGSAMELYNDFGYHQKADKIRKQIEALDPNSESYKKEKETLEKVLSAYAGNIRNELFKNNL